MWLGELTVGLMLLVATFLLLRAASPKDGRPPAFMQVALMQTVIPFSILLGFCVSGTLIVYSVTAHWAANG